MTAELVPISANCRPGLVHNKKFIVIHITDNFKYGAGARNHAKFLMDVAKTGAPYVSWHYTVDDKEIIQHIPDNEIAWHSTDGRAENGGNMSGIGIELCINSDGNFAQTLENAKWLVASLCIKYGWSVQVVVKQHHDFYNKNCPSKIRNEGTWGSFLDGCQFYINQIKAPEVPVVAPPAITLVTINTNWAPLWLLSTDLKRKLTLMPRGYQVILVDKNNPNWWTVNYKGIIGRASAQYLK